MAGRAAGLVLAAALTAAGCGATKLPPTTALHDQTSTQQRLDTIDCKAEVGYRLNYNGDDSEAVNVLRHVFVLGTAGAAVAGVATATATASSTAVSDALIAGGSAGSVAGTALGIGGRSRFEREWIACMESRGYAIVAPSSAIH